MSHGGGLLGHRQEGGCLLLPDALLVVCGGGPCSGWEGHGHVQGRRQVEWAEWDGRTESQNRDVCRHLSGDRQDVAV